MVSSLGPALRISSGLSIVKTLKTDSRASAAGGATTWRMLLIAGQATTTAVLLLVVGGLALRSLLAVTQVDPGFETRGVAVASVAPALVGHDQDEAYRYLSRAAAAVRELPNVEAAGWRFGSRLSTTCPSTSGSTSLDAEPAGQAVPPETARPAMSSLRQAPRVRPDRVLPRVDDRAKKAPPGLSPVRRPMAISPAMISARRSRVTGAARATTGRGGLTDCPRSRDRDRRHAAQRIAAIGAAGRHDFRAGWRDDGRDALSVPSPRPAGHRGSRGPEHSRERGRPRGRGLGRRTR